MKPWTDFLPQVAINTYGAPRIVHLEAIADSAIEFCEKTKAWKETSSYPLAAGKFVYEFMPDAKTLVVQIMSAGLRTTTNGRPVFVEIKPPEWCDYYYHGWRTGYNYGSSPLYVTQINPVEFIPVPAPNVTATMDMILALKPTRDSIQGPDFLFDDYKETIVKGALARLMSMSGKPWTNVAEAVAMDSAFRHDVDIANLRAAKAFGRGQHRVRASFL